MKLKKELLLLAVLAGLLSGIISWYHAQAARFLTVSMEVTTSTELETPIFQLFYDVGRGFNERDSKSFLLNTDGATKTISHTVPSPSICGLRLDYLNGPGQVTLENIALHSNAGESIFLSLTRERLQVNQTASFHFNPRSLQATAISTATDPYIHLMFEPACSVAITGIQLKDISFALKSFFVLYAGIGLIFLLTQQKKAEC